MPIARVYANDSDLQANGNGLVLFHIPRRRNQRELFTIDSKEGIITTLNSLDYEEEPVHNITVLASDLGKPSLTSTALVIVDVVDIQEPVEEMSSPIFAHRYYEMEVKFFNIRQLYSSAGTQNYGLTNLPKPILSFIGGRKLCHTSELVSTKCEF